MLLILSESAAALSDFVSSSFSGTAPVRESLRERARLVTLTRISRSGAPIVFLRRAGLASTWRGRRDVERSAELTRAMTEWVRRTGRLGGLLLAIAPVREISEIRIRVSEGSRAPNL